MQQIAYHGVKDYTFEYKLSTDTNWTTAPTQNSAEYTCEGLTGGKSYDLRVTVTDRAGNSGTGTNSANTVKPEKNPGGVITDISTDPNDLPKIADLTFPRTAQKYDITNTPVSVSYQGNYGSELTSTILAQTDWYLFASSSEVDYILARGPEITMGRSFALNNRGGNFG